MNSTANKTGITQRVKHALLGLSLLGLACQVSAQTQVDDAWVRATVAGQQASGAFMTITASDDSKLLTLLPQTLPVQLRYRTRWWVTVQRQA